MTNSKITTRSGNGAFVTRSLEGATRTGLLQWMWARRCGVRDGSGGLPAMGTPLDDSPCPDRGSLMPAELMTEFIRGRIQSYVERDEREFNEALASVDADFLALWAVNDEIAQVQSVLQALAVKLEALIQQPRITAKDVVRGPAEKDTPESVVIARRQRVKDAAATAVRADVAAVAGRISALNQRYSAHAYPVLLAFEHYVTRTNQARAQIERLCSAYRRQVTLHHPTGSAIQRAWADTVSVPTPDRTTQRCQWLPIDTTDIPAAPVADESDPLKEG